MSVSAAGTAMDSPLPRSLPRFQRRILLMVTGLSPQVVTETLYALAQDGGAHLPNEVHLLTTQEGAERARLALLSKDPGWFYRLCRDYALDGIRFDTSQIHLLRDVHGAVLPDIRTPEENERAADLITEKVRELTADPESMLHVSIAGGRKTMGYYAGYALSLFGRPQDRLSHVLVSEPFESSWEFFYPTPYSRVITTRDNKLVDTADAQVTLADIPFVSLRTGLPKRLLEGQAQLSQTVAAARQALLPPRLYVDLAHHCVWAGEERVDMTPTELAFYAMFARQCQAGRPALKRKGADLHKLYLQELEQIINPASGDWDRVQQALANGMDTSYFDQRKSRTNAALENALGSHLAEAYKIHNEGQRTGRFHLRLDAQAIQFGA